MHAVDCSDPVSSDRQQLACVLLEKLKKPVWSPFWATAANRVIKMWVVFKELE
jgi:hypothetical protein